MKRRDFIAGAVSIGVAGGALRLEAALPVSGLDHVNIRVPDVRRAAEFYIKLFGVQVARAPTAKAQTAIQLLPPANYGSSDWARVFWRFLPRGRNSSRGLITSLLRL